MTLGVFFTRGVGIATWSKTGSLQRELAVYREMVRRGVGVTFFTYDKPGSAVAAEVAGVGDVIRIESRWLTGRLGWLWPGRRRVLQRTRSLAVIKTNQLIGGREAMVAAAASGVPLVARAGYLPSVLERFDGDPAAVTRLESEEREVVGAAAAVVVTTPFLRDYVVDRYGVRPERAHVVPNYVPDHFFEASRPPRAPGPFRVLTVGRHHGHKNYPLLVAALRGWPGVIWRNIGDGPLREQNLAVARAAEVACDFAARVENPALPAEYAAADAFVLCSKSEGHPKVLLEAMASGCACVVTDTEGTRGEVEDGVTGLVVEPSAAALRAGLERLQDSPELAARLGAAARVAMRRRCGLDVVVEQELAVHRAVASRRG